MSRVWSEPPAIKVETDARDLPVKLTWEGKTHQAQRVVQRWEVDTDWWTEDGRVWRRYFALTPRTGLLCVIYLDLVTQTWYLNTLYD